VLGSKWREALLNRTDQSARTDIQNIASLVSVE